MAMSWEEIADARMREINRLRGVVRCSTSDAFIIEQAMDVYKAAKNALHDASPEKPDDDVPLSINEVKQTTMMQTIADFIALIEVMDCDVFIDHASRGEKA